MLEILKIQEKVDKVKLFNLVLTPLAFAQGNSYESITLYKGLDHYLESFNVSFEELLTPVKVTIFYMDSKGLNSSVTDISLFSQNGYRQKSLPVKAWDNKFTEKNNFSNVAYGETSIKVVFDRALTANEKVDFTFIGYQRKKVS